MRSFLRILAVVSACLFAALAFSQTTVAPFLSSKVQLLDNSGLVCSGCLLDTFAAGTLSPLVTYSESTGTTPNANPIVLDSAGRATIYLTSASYKFRLRTAAGSTIWTQDVISWATPLSTFAGLIDTGDLTLQQSTAATNGANQNSNNLKVQGAFWNGSASATETCSLQDVLGTGTNPTVAFALTCSGSSGATTFSVVPNTAFTGNVAVGGTLGVTGTISTLGGETQCGLVNGVYMICPSTTGADWCAKVATADTALGVKGGLIKVNKAAGTSCAAGFTLRNSLEFIDDSDYSARTITIGTGGISIKGMGLTNAGSTPFGTRLTYVGSAGSDLMSIVGSSGTQLDKITIENIILNGNNTARYSMLAQWANAGTVKDVRFQGAATANTYFQTSIDWKFYNAGWTFCQGSGGAGYCAIWDGGSGNNHIYGGQTEQGAASTNPQFAFSGSINSFEISGLDFDTCFPFGGFISIQGQDGVNSAFPGALTGIGQGRPINLDIHPGFMNHCTGATAPAQGADILVTDASAAQKPTKIHIHDVQMVAGASPGTVAIKFDQATDNEVNDIISTGHTAGTAATVQMTANASLIRMQNVSSGDTNRFVAAAEVPQDCVQVSASNATWYQCNGGQRLGSGTTALPSLTLSGTGADTGTGWSNPGSTGYWRFSTQSNDDFLLSPTGPVLHNAFVYGIANGDSFGSSCLTGVGSTAQGVITASTSCSSANSSGSYKAAKYLSDTNCAAVGTAASPSVAACGSASAGHFSCATNATGATCQVNTTAVTANSEIIVFESDTAATGTALSVTCNTGTNVLPTSRLLASSVAGASFTINLGTVTTNPACFSYLIVN